MKHSSKHPKAGQMVKIASGEFAGEDYRVAEEAADALAEAIGEFFNVEIGEHVGGSPGNCPWQNALEVIQQAISEREHGEREMEQLSHDGQL